MLRVGIIQMRCGTDPDVNLAAALDHIRQAAAAGADVVCLPELFKTQYFCQIEDHANFDLAEPIPGPTSQRLSAAAAEHQAVIVGSIFERRAAGVYHNTAVVFDADGRCAGMYRKMHIPDDPLYHEKFYFSPGDLGFPAFQTRYGCIGSLVCWDQWYPEAARITALRGAEIIFFPTAIGWHPEEKERWGAQQHSSWEVVQRAHAIANGCFVVAVNRIGYEGEPNAGIQFWGQSFVADPGGVVLERAPVDEEHITVVELDMNAIRQQREHWPFLRDRRIDAYQEITRRYIDDASAQ